jgi:hypothetical protein
MAAAQHKLSRRDVLAAACSAPVAGVAAASLPRHSGLAPEPKTTGGQSIFAAPAPEGRWIPDQVPDDEKQRESRWNKALVRYVRAEAGVAAVAHSEDDDLYDRALGRHNAALARLLRTAAPDLAAVERKLDLILRHSVFELTFGESCLEALQRDIRRLAEMA